MSDAPTNAFDLETLLATPMPIIVALPVRALRDCRQWPRDIGPTDRVITIGVHLDAAPCPLDSSLEDVPDAASSGETLRMAVDGAVGDAALETLRAGGTVYVACRAGISRSKLVAILITLRWWGDNIPLTAAAASVATDAVDGQCRPAEWARHFLHTLEWHRAARAGRPPTFPWLDVLQQCRFARGMRRAETKRLQALEATHARLQAENARLRARAGLARAERLTREDVRAHRERGAMPKPPHVYCPRCHAVGRADPGAGCGNCGNNPLISRCSAGSPEPPLR